MVRLPNGEEVEVDQSNPVAGADGRIIQRPCYICGSWGHVSTECPELGESERQQARARAAARRAERSSTSLLQVVRSFVQQSYLISPSIILLDSCSESSVL